MPCQDVLRPRASSTVQSKGLSDWLANNNSLFHGLGRFSKGGLELLGTSFPNIINSILSNRLETNLIPSLLCSITMEKTLQIYAAFAALVLTLVWSFTKKKSNSFPFPPGVCCLILLISSYSCDLADDTTFFLAQRTAFDRKCSRYAE